MSRVQQNLKALNQLGGEIHPSQYDISPLNSFGLHVTMDQKFIVGIGVGIAEPGKRTVIVMDQEGCHLAEYDQQLLRHPFRITSTTNGNIFVVDSLMEAVGKVVVLDRKGNVLNIYNGHPDPFFQDKRFESKCILNTPADNVIVCDSTNNVVHVLNFEGHNIAFFKTDELGIFRPLSLAMSTQGHFYLECTTKDSRPETAKLYKMEYSGF